MLATRPAIHLQRDAHSLSTVRAVLHAMDMCGQLASATYYHCTTTARVPVVVQMLECCL